MSLVDRSGIPPGLNSEHKVTQHCSRLSVRGPNGTYAPPETKKSEKNTAQHTTTHTTSHNTTHSTTLHNTTEQRTIQDTRDKLKQYEDIIAQLQETNLRLDSQLTDAKLQIKKQSEKILELERLVNQQRTEINNKNPEPVDRKHEEMKSTTRADTIFRQNLKKIIEEEFRIKEFERQQIKVI